MKNFGYEFNILYGAIGLIMAVVGVVLLFSGQLASIIIGIIFILCGGGLGYLGIKSLLKVKKLIAEQKIIDANEKKIKEEIVASGLCPKCGNKVSPEDEFCSKCGQNLKK